MSIPTDKLQVVSSRWTFFLKLALPVFWTCFFGTATIAILFFISLDGIAEPFTPLSARLLVASFFVATMGLFYLLFMRNKWVGLTPSHIYVSNFMKSRKYTYNSLAKIEESKAFFFFKRVTLHFHEPTLFGKTIFFMSNYYWHYFLNKHPEVLQQILDATGSLPKIPEELKEENKKK